MSMINDALRRASDAAKSARGSATPLPPMPVSPPPLPPSAYSVPSAPTMESPPLTEPESDEESENSSPRKTILVLLIVILSVGGGIGFKYWKRKQATKLAEMIVNAAKTRKAEAPVSTQPGSTQAAGTSTANASTPAPRPTVTAPVPTPAPAVAAVPVKFPSLRLQSIFYRPANPSVMINGKTLFIADEIQGVTIADISPASVTLVLSGQTNVLTLR